MSISNKVQLPVSRGLEVNPEKKAVGLNQKPKVDDTQYVPQQFKDVAKSMEEQFVQIMLDQMEKTVDSSEATDGAGMDFYKSLEKSERAKIMTAQNNLGLQGLVLDQIYPKRLRNEMAMKHYQAQNAQIHQKLPSYKIDRKTDSIEMRQNDSTSLSDHPQSSKTIEDGGLHE